MSWSKVLQSPWVVRVSWFAVVVAGGCAAQTDDPGSTPNPVWQGSAGMFAGEAGEMATAGSFADGAAGIMGAAGMTSVGVAGSDAFAGAGAIAGTGTGAEAGTGAVAGTGGIAGMEGGMGGMDGTLPRGDLGMGDGSDVITIGDSWMNFLLTGIEQSLERVSGRDYRNFAVLGTLVLNGQIPNQYYTARMRNPNIKTVVMTGGGNDILNSPCTGDACRPLVDQVSDRLTMLIQDEMGMDGVEDVVLIGYTYPSNMGKHASLDYSIMLSKESCTKNTMPRCHFVDSTQLPIMLQDGIHPNPAGYDLIGRTVWELMQAEGMRR
jgi:lysophospholipase L1-like esterase